MTYHPVRPHSPAEVAQNLLRRLGVTSAPIDVSAVAEALGATVKYTTFPKSEDVSGFCAPQADGGAVIAINRSHPATRKRFTLAHEIGHLVLHSRKAGIHLDQYRRDSESARGTDRKEIEANVFAAELLMPSALVRDECRLGVMSSMTHRKGDIDQEVRRLSVRFKVSQEAMQIRLGRLGLLVSW